MKAKKKERAIKESQLQICLPGIINREKNHSTYFNNSKTSKNKQSYNLCKIFKTFYASQKNIEKNLPI